MLPFAEPATGAAVAGVQPLPPIKGNCLCILSQGVNNIKVLPGTGLCRELFHMWEMQLSPHSEKPVGEKSGTQDPCPRTGSPVGNYACILPRLL